MFTVHGGFAYLVYLMTVFALLIDIVLNRARISSRLATPFLDAVGQPIEASPC